MARFCYKDVTNDAATRMAPMFRKLIRGLVFTRIWELQTGSFICSRGAGQRGGVVL